MNSMLAYKRHWWREVLSSIAGGKVEVCSFLSGIVVFTWSVASAEVPHAMPNLVANPDLSMEDGLGTAMIGWSLDIQYRAETTVVAKPIEAGAFSVRASGRGWASLQQTKLGLVPGAKYRLSYDVRTAGLCGAWPHFYLCDGNFSWTKDQTGAMFPNDTKGAWVHQEKTLVALKGFGRVGHTLRIDCLYGNPVGEVAFEIRNLRLEAVDPAFAEKSFPRNCPGRLKARIVPVDPLLTAVDSSNGRMSFYWPGASSARSTNCTLVARMDEASEVRAALGANGYATLAFGKMETGRHELVLTVLDEAGRTVETDSYRIVARTSVQEDEIGRRLNNFVTELVNRPLSDGIVTFRRPKAGWTWISVGMALEDDSDVRGYLDNGAHAVLSRREGEQYIETQRWLEAGVHELRIVGARPGRTLKVHAVKPIIGNAPSNLTAKPVQCKYNFEYSLPFPRRFGLISTFNTLYMKNSCLDDESRFDIGYFLERGLQLMGNDKFEPDDPDRQTFASTLAHLKSGGWRSGRTMNVDENRILPETHIAVNFSEAAWALFDENPAHRMNVFYADTATGDYFRRPEINVSEIAAIVNTGNGTGLLMPECYAPVLGTRESLRQFVDGYANFLHVSEQMVPAARGATVLYTAGYIDLFDWSNYVCPAVDIKVHYSDLVRAFATDSRFAECAGLGFGGAICCEEEFRRWGARVLRHYALEGATDDLAGSYGYVWTPGYVKDPDFEQGLTNWTCRPAESGALYAERIRRYGTDYQNRVGAARGQGDAVAVFKASPMGSSAVMQKISGLEPGRHYVLHFAVADRQTMVPRSAKAPRSVKRFFSAWMEGAEEVKELSYERFRRGQRLFRSVFKAMSPEATLILSDGRGGELNPPGTELLLNYIVFRPYYVEKDAEVAEVVSTLGWKSR